MMNIVRVLSLSCALAALTACASMSEQTAMPQASAQSLMSLDAVAAPQGLFGFCAAHRDTCVATANVGFSAAWATGATNAGAGAAAPRAEDLFQRLLGAYTQAHVAQTAPRAHLGIEQWRQLVNVNRTINWRIAPASDRRLYHQDDVWALPLSAPTYDVRREGDCEDYALEKRHALLASGWSADTLSLAVAAAPGEGLHAVLIAHTDRGDFALDNLHEGPVKVEDLGYYWLSMQSGASLLHWTSVRLESAAALSPEFAFQQQMSLATSAGDRPPNDTPVTANLAKPADSAPAPFYTPAQEQVRLRPHLDWFIRGTSGELGREIDWDY